MPDTCHTRERGNPGFSPRRHEEILLAVILSAIEESIKNGHCEAQSTVRCPAEAVAISRITCSSPPSRSQLATKIPSHEFALRYSLFDIGYSVPPS